MKSALLLLAATLILQAQDFPPLGEAPDQEQRGANIQRTMSLLAGSTARNRNQVKILFYGQSITEQAWTKLVEQDLRQRFPHADLAIENRAIGGHSSQLLVKTAEADLYPFYPDLVIFHVYGDHQRYEDIIRRIRERTTAEVLLQTDHLNANAKPDEETDPSKLDPSNWEAWFNYNFLPGLAEKYGVGLAGVRDDWKRYLAKNNVEPKDLLKDNVHLNEHGEFLMAEIIKTYLRHHPEQSPAKNETVRRIPFDPAAFPHQFKFTGNRVDAIMATEGEPVEVGVLLDGKLPSDSRSTAVFTRVSGYRGTNWPVLLRVQRGPAPLVEEIWTIRIADNSDDYSEFRFTLTGSRTGPDGEGSAKEQFVSKSGRIVIEPEDWNLQFSRKVFGQPLDPDAEITFAVKHLSVDSFTAEPTGGRVTIIQGVPAGDHVLTLRSASRKPPIAFLEVFNPPMPATEDPAQDASAR